MLDAILKNNRRPQSANQKEINYKHQRPDNEKWLICKQGDLRVLQLQMYRASEVLYKPNAIMKCQCTH